MNEIQKIDDARLMQLQSWLTEVLREPLQSLTTASADASFRRYFRVQTATQSFIAMDAPPNQEDCTPFVRVAHLFSAVRVPTIYAQNIADGFLLLEDFGAYTYLRAIEETPLAAQGLYLEALDSLVQLQASSRAGELPRYDAALLQREMDLFPTWYLNQHLGKTWTAEQQGVWEKTCAVLLANNLAQPCVYVHRDFHSRNLMVTPAAPGILDFQDAVYGPISYDLVSLLKDAYVAWDESQILDWAIRYWERAKAAQLPIAPEFADFFRDFEWMGVQRHLKVLGIFARLYHRDGKAGYLKDMPLVLHYLRQACQRYEALHSLLHLLDAAEDLPQRPAFTL